MPLAISPNKIAVREALKDLDDKSLNQLLEYIDQIVRLRLSKDDVNAKTRGDEITTEIGQVFPQHIVRKILENAKSDIYRARLFLTREGVFNTQIYDEQIGNAIMELVEINNSINHSGASHLYIKEAFIGINKSFKDGDYLGHARNWIKENNFKIDDGFLLTSLMRLVESHYKWKHNEKAHKIVTSLFIALYNNS